MRAAYVQDRRIELLEEYPTPKIRPGEALIRVNYGGICGTDLEILKGYYSFKGVPGHEFVGVVEAPTGSGLVDKRVVGEINITCGACSMCSKGLSNHCLRRSVLGIKGRDGAFAEYVTLPLRNLHVVPEAISDTQAVFTEPLAAAYEILEQVEIVPDQEVLVLGDGRIGTLIAQVLKAEGKGVVLAGHHRKKLSLLRQLGIKSLHETELGADEQFDLVIDATGSPEGLASALKFVRPRGTVVLKSTVANKSMVDVSRVVVNEINLLGSRCGPFPRALHALDTRRIKVDELLSEIFPLEDVRTAFELAEKPETFKVLLRTD